MSGKAGRPVTAPTLCLRKSRATRGLVARVLVVHSGRERAYRPRARIRGESELLTGRGPAGMRYS
jgi:hypothetical protein